ncbi:MAG TPA: RNA-binding protein [Ramlibacter sp.]|uniref:RNA-binding protein n=1 Tax=Ramlibacter sp. TaxID=1917967 RepID=UPI002ECFD116
MKPFHLDSKMHTMGGKFYPTGWMVLMFPGEQEAQDAARKLADGGIADTEVMMVTPDQFRAEILGRAGDDAILPSAGTEGDTVRQFATYAMRGHHALMVHAPDSEQSERVMELLHDCPIAYGQRYRKLVIEDIVEPTLPG